MNPISSYAHQRPERESLRATIGEHNLHDAVKLGFERLLIDGQRLNWTRWETNGLIVRRGVRNRPHRHDQRDNVHPYGKVGDPAKLPQGSDLPEHHSYEGFSMRCDRDPSETNHPRSKQHCRR